MLGNERRRGAGEFLRSPNRAVQSPIICVSSGTARIEPTNEPTSKPLPARRCDGRDGRCSEFFGYNLNCRLARGDLDYRISGLPAGSRWTTTWIDLARAPNSEIHGPAECAAVSSSAKSKFGKFGRFGRFNFRPCFHTTGSDPRGFWTVMGVDLDVIVVQVRTVARAGISHLQSQSTHQRPTGHRVSASQSRAATISF
jgi:hypothetical protein